MIRRDDEPSQDEITSPAPALTASDPEFYQAVRRVVDAALAWRFATSGGTMAEEEHAAEQLVDAVDDMVGRV